MLRSAPFRRALAAAVTGTLALAAPALADPVKAGPPVPDELAVIAVDGTPSTSAASFSLNRFSTADGSYRGRIAFPNSGASALSVVAAPATTLRGASVERSADGNSLTVAAANVEPGASVTTAQNTWRALKIGADGTYTSQPFGALTSSAAPMGVATVDGSRYWFSRLAAGTTNHTIASGESASTTLTSSNLTLPQNIEIADGTYYTVLAAGVYRLPGGLPTTAAAGAPQQVVAATTSFDVAFVDTDGVSGADTMYVARGAAGLSKFVKSGDTWVARGATAGTYGWITARAVAGAVEIYSVNGAAGTQLQKTVDTADAGAALTTTGPTAIASAAGNTRFDGLAFAPGTGFRADSTPHQASPPRISASATTGYAIVGGQTKTTVDLEISDADTPLSELTLTATTNNDRFLPADHVTFSGTGATRTATFDPIAAGLVGITFTVRDADGASAVPYTLTSYGPTPDPTGHYYLGYVDLSADLDVGDGYFLGISDEVNSPALFRTGVTGNAQNTFSGFPSGEGDFESVTRFGNTVMWVASHGNNRSGAARPERQLLSFETISGSGLTTALTYRNGYTRLLTQWKAWDAANGHGLGANYLKLNTATASGVIPNAPNGFNIEGATMAPGSTTEAWFGLRAPTITGIDGVERAVILPVKNIDQLTSNTVDAVLGQPIFLDLGGRSIRDIAKNANDQYLIEAGTGDTEDSLKGWALYTWDGNPAHDPQLVKELPTNETQIGAWEGIAQLPDNLTAGSRVLLTADSGDTGLGRTYGQYVTLDAPMARPAAATNVKGVTRAGALDLTWDAAAGATRYRVAVRNAAGQNAPGTPFFTTDTKATLEPLTPGVEWTATVLTENYAARQPSVSVKATPSQGPRTPTSSTVELVGDRVWGASMKAVATFSDPSVRGTVRFYGGPYDLGTSDQQKIPVVNGKAELTVTSINPGFNNVRAVFTPTNPEEFAASESSNTIFVDARPVQPALELVSITGERVAGQPLTFTYKLVGYTKQQLYPGPYGLPIAVRSWLNGASTQTYVGGGSYDETTGEATITATLAAGKHRIEGMTGNFGPQMTSLATDAIPVTIAPAGTSAPQVPALKRPKVFVSVSGPRLMGVAQTYTARVSDPTLAGTVQFFQDEFEALGTPVPVVNGIASWTGKTRDEVTQPQVSAIFEPAADRDTTVSPVSPYVTPRLGSTTQAPPTVPTATKTSLSIEGSRRAGEPLAATVTVAPAVAAPFAANDTIGYVELKDGEKIVDLVQVIGGKASFDLSGLAVGAHPLAARFVPTDEERSTGSSAAETVPVVVETSADGGIGGTVPAVLSLTLRAPESFGAFVPGVDRTYETSTTASVTSTAGDAALSVDGGKLANGAFVLSEPLQVAFSKSNWDAPASNDVVTVGLKQHVGANEPLRTGSYSKTLTFTLSSTTP